MTIIAAAYDPKGRVAVIGSDSLGSSWTCNVHGSKLVRLRDDVVVGIAGSYVLGRWFREVGASVLGEDPPGVAVDRMWAAWWKWAREQGHGKTLDGGDLQVPGSCIVATPEGLYTTQADGSVLENPDHYATQGSGAAVALGSLATSCGFGIDLGAAVSLAVHAAIRHVPTCGGPVHLQIIHPPAVSILRVVAQAE